MEHQWKGRTGNGYVFFAMQYCEEDQIILWVILFQHVISTTRITQNY